MENQPGTREYYEVARTGSLLNLKLKRGIIPAIAEGRVLVAVKAVGLNYADIFAIMGLYSATPQGAFTPGFEFAGVVAESASPEFRVGDRVMGVTKFGGYTSHILADRRYLVHLPDHWTFEQGAAYPVQTLTAYYALVTLGALQPGQTVLIHSAAGGVGLQAQRIAKKLSAYTIGVVGRSEKLEALRQEGFDGGIVRGAAFRQDLQKTLGARNLDLVLEATGGKYFRQSYQALAPMGRIVAYGSASFTPSAHKPNYLTLIFRYLFRPKIDPLAMITDNKSVMAFNLIWLYEHHELMKNLLAELHALQLPPPRIGYRFPFNAVQEALSLFRSGSTTGKLVLYFPE